MNELFEYACNLPTLAVRFDNGGFYVMEHGRAVVSVVGDDEKGYTTIAFGKVATNRNKESVKRTLRRFRRPVYAGYRR
jgi:hypothetical protein